MKENRHEAKIPDEVIAQIGGLLDSICGLLAPYMIALTPQERRTMLKMGDKSLSFVEKCHQLAHENPSLVPGYLDMAFFDIDFSDACNLWGLHNKALQLNQNIDDTTMAAGNEAFYGSLAFYSYVHLAANKDVPGAKAVYDDLKDRFPGRPRQHISSVAEAVAGTEVNRRAFLKPLSRGFLSTRPLCEGFRTQPCRVPKDTKRV